MPEQHPIPDKPKTASSTPTTFSPHLLSLRFLVFLERFQIFYSHHPKLRAIFLFLFAVLQTLCPLADNNVSTAVMALSWATMISVCFSRRVTVYAAMPLYICVIFRLVFNMYEHIRGLTDIKILDLSTKIGLPDALVSAVIMACCAITVHQWTQIESVRIFVSAGVKGLFVRRWRTEYEGRLLSVMEKHEGAIKRFCAHMLEWMLVDSKKGARGDCGHCIAKREAEKKKGQEYEYPVWCAQQQHQPELTQWTQSQILLFRAPAEDKVTVLSTFNDMLATAKEALNGFQENAQEILDMEQDVVQRMRLTTQEFGILKGPKKLEAETTEWCRKEWEKEFCDGKGRRLLKLTGLLLSLWDALSAELMQQGGEDERPRVGDHLPAGITEAMNWFLVVQGCAATGLGNRQAWENEVDKIDIEKPLLGREAVS